MRRAFQILIFLLLATRCFSSGCDNAIYVEPASKCNYTQYTLGASAGKVCNTDCGWASSGIYKEVWLKTTMPKSGRISVRTEGHYICGYMSIYSGSCGNLKTLICSSNGRLPENLDNSSVNPGETLYIRIALCSSSTVGVCVLALDKITETTCLGSATVAANFCKDATPIKSPKGYCGNTSATYTAERPYGLSFCGSIENNSWLKFTAMEESAELNIHVSNCQRGIGIQMNIYETTDCVHFTSKSNCWNPAIETDGVIEATDLTIGKEYYLMIDGYAGDVCDYVISAGKGVAVAQTFFEETICKGERYNKNGFDETEQGIYTQELIGPNNKDSIVVLNLTVLDPVQTYLDATIYKCEKYTENGFNVNKAGKHYLNLKSAAGCDSIVELDLNVIPNKEGSIAATICSGETYSSNGFNESTAGTYKKTFQTTQGCDSIVTLTLTVVDGLDLSVSGDVNICSGESATIYAAGGSTYIWQDTNGNEIGRGDSIVLTPTTTTTYKLYSKNIIEEETSKEEKCKASDYPQVTIGTQTWMAENYRCSKYDTESEAYKAGIYKIPTSTTGVYTPYYTDATDEALWDSESKTKYSVYLSKEQISKLGYLYSWAAVVGVADGLSQTTDFTKKRQGICPNGWHVPTKYEWRTLANYIGSENYAGRYLRTKTGWYYDGASSSNDDFGFSALPAGGATGNVNSSVGHYTHYWTTNQVATTDAYIRGISGAVNSLYETGHTLTPKSDAKSVRCLKD